MGLEDFLYVKEALGQYGRKIRVYKIRTMYSGAETGLDEVVNEKGMDGLGKPMDDPRIIPSRRFLRRYWLDELPQLYNLFRGELGFVGIRPGGDIEWSRYPEEFMRRALRFKPGLFSVAYSELGVENFRGLVGVEERYLDQKEVSPLLTDIWYFLKIVCNIVFKGVRSR